jgi:hypothetical protein
MRLRFLTIRVRLPLGQPSPVARRRWRRQLYAMGELVQELFYLAFLRLLAHYTDSRLVGGEYLSRVRPMFSQALSCQVSVFEPVWSKT